MKILIIGNGAREHALTWAISQNPRCTKIYCSPGNAGTAELATNIDTEQNHVLTNFLRMVHRIKGHDRLDVSRRNIQLFPYRNHRFRTY